MRFLKGYPDIKIAIEQIPLLGQDKLNCDELKDFLVKNSNFVEEKQTPEGTGIRRLFRIYDWLKYGQSKDVRKRLGK